MLPLAFLPNVGPVELLIVLVTAVFLVYPACRICAKAGFPWQAGLLAALPFINLALLFWLALAPWPAARGQTQPSPFRKS